MLISDLFQKKNTIYSFEIFPPKPTADVSAVADTIERLAALSPDYALAEYSPRLAGGLNGAGIAPFYRQEK